MKHVLSVHTILLFLITAALIACTKDDLSVTSQENVAVSQLPQNNTARPNPAYFGLISGVLDPVPIKASIVAYNDNFLSEETITDPDGAFKIGDLPPGAYTLLISYVPVSFSTYLTFEVYKITVLPGTLTDLGIINLPD